MSQMVHGNSGTLYKDYPAVIDLLGAMVFPVGLVSRTAIEGLVTAKGRS